MSIKVRMWDSISNRMHHWPAVNQIPLKDFKLDHYTLMVSLGLADKNGKDIYEGDIYKINGNEYTVFLKNGALCGGLNFENCEPLGWRPYGLEELQEDDFFSTIEIIGNTYEAWRNPSPIDDLVDNQRKINKSQS